MVQSVSHHAASAYSSLELVHMRRMLVTAGNQIQCPRCGAHPSITAHEDARDRSATSYDVRCRGCGGGSVLGNLPDGLA